MSPPFSAGVVGFDFSHTGSAAVDAEISDHTLIPPHRYEYDDHRVLLRPTEWPL